MKPGQDFTVQVSTRARRVLLKVQPGRGLVVTVPKGFPRHRVDEVVADKRVWIERALAELEASTPEIYRLWPPEQLHLTALGQTCRVVQVSSEPGQNKRQRWLDSSVLELAVPRAVLAEPDTETSRLVLARGIAEALKGRARRHLQQRLDALSHRSGLPYARLTVRGQRTRWGSCSSNGTISLNYKLLFIAPELLDYVCLHELAHTRHLDHSPAYWQLLESVCPGAVALDRRLNSAARSVPPWLELAR